MDTIHLLLAAAPGAADRLFAQLARAPFYTELDRVAAWAWRPGDEITIVLADHCVTAKANILAIDPSPNAVGRVRVTFHPAPSWETAISTLAGKPIGFVLFPKSAAPAVSDEAVEAGAKALYDKWEGRPGWVPWTPRGNSLAQDQARDHARAVLIAASLTRPPMTEIDDGMVERDAKPASPCPTCNGNRWLGAREMLPGSTPENTVSRDMGRACPDCAVSTGGTNG